MSQLYTRADMRTSGKMLACPVPSLLQFGDDYDGLTEEFNTRNMRGVAGARYLRQLGGFMRVQMAILFAGFVCFAYVSGGAIAKQPIRFPNLPELYAVTGVSPSDVLNVYEQPSLQTTILGTLPPTATHIEVTALTEDGRWGWVNAKEQPGWVSMQFMQDMEEPFWWELRRPLYCHGTDPIWVAVIDGDSAGGITITPESRASVSMKFGWLRDSWGRSDWGKPVTAAISFKGDTTEATAIIRAESCMDGTTPGLFGLSVYLSTSEPVLENTFSRYSYSGCCSIADH